MDSNFIYMFYGVGTAATAAFLFTLLYQWWCSEPKPNDISKVLDDMHLVDQALYLNIIDAADPLIDFAHKKPQLFVRSSEVAGIFLNAAVDVAVELNVTKGITEDSTQVYIRLNPEAKLTHVHVTHKDRSRAIIEACVKALKNG